MLLFRDDGWKPSTMLKLIKVARSKWIMSCVFLTSDNDDGDNEDDNNNNNNNNNNNV